MQVSVVQGQDVNSQLISDRLRQSGFLTKLVAWTDFGRDHTMCGQSTAIILDAGAADLNLPPMIRNLRLSGIEALLIVLSPRSDWRESVNCLDAGSDEYIVKPVRSEQIAAKLRALIRRSAGTTTEALSIGAFRLDLHARCAWLNGACLDLTRNEFRLLRLFLMNSDRVLSHDELLERLYPEAPGRSHNALEVQITRLRRKVGKNRIRTIRGLGYRFDCEAAGDDENIEPCKKGSSGPTPVAPVARETALDYCI